MTMKRLTFTRILSLTLLFFLLQYVSFRTQGADNPNPSGKYYEEIQHGRALLADLLEEYPGISVAVSKGEDVIWEETLGWADVKNKIPATPDHQFRYYSLSKSIAGLAAAKMVQDGQLDLDAPVNFYLPDLPEHYCDVKVHQLISHTAGVRHYKKNEWRQISHYHCDSVAQALPVFIDDPLEFEPGTGYTYTSFGYVLLCHVLEKASGVAYDDYIQEHFLDLLGLETIGLDQSETAQRNPSKFYHKWNGKHAQEAKAVDNSCKFGGGGYIGTADELMQLHQALVTGRILEPEMTERYYETFLKADSTAVGYAYGIGVNRADDGTLFNAHTGSALGGFNVLIVVPEQELVIVILANRFSEKMIDTAKEILEMFLAQA